MAGLLLHLNLDGRAVDASLLHRGLQAMQNRGIDGASRWLYRNIALGQQNFLVCPEDVPCPLLRNTEEGPIALVFDGRLDNRDALLGEIGPAAAADCADAELVLIAYQLWGDACFRKLRGSLALILADTRESESSKICLFRTPLGGRELYYHAAARYFLAATEPAALLAHPDVSNDLSVPAMRSYFAYFNSYSRESFFRSVMQLLPGELLVLESGQIRLTRDAPGIGMKPLRYRDDAAYAEHFRELLLRATHRACRSRGDVGIMLSSGMDSGPAAYFASAHLASVGRSFTAYSWALPGFPVADESPLIRALAKHAGLALKIADADDCWPLSQHETRPLSPNTPLSNAFQGLKDRVYGMAADDGCRVLLNAAVGDSLYAGNAYYLADLFADRQWRCLAGEFYHRLARLNVLQLYHDPALRVLVKRALGMRRNPLRSPEWLVANVREPGADLHNWPPELIEHVRQNQYRTLLGLGLSGVSSAVDFFANRFGLEIRDPYLDWDLADFMLSIPSYRAERPGELKYIARNAMRGVMLESLRTQSRKGVLSEFFYYGVFKRSRQLLNRLLTAKEAEWPEYVDRRWLLTALAKEQPNQTEAMVIWQCVTFEMWRIRFLK